MTGCIYGYGYGYEYEYEYWLGWGWHLGKAVRGDGGGAEEGGCWGLAGRAYFSVLGFLGYAEDCRWGGGEGEGVWVYGVHGVDVGEKKGGGEEIESN